MTPEQYKAKRLALGLTQGKLAKHLDDTREKINQLERGKRTIKKVDEYALLYLELVLNRKPQPVKKEGK